MPILPVNPNGGSADSGVDNTHIPPVPPPSSSVAPDTFFVAGQDAVSSIPPVVQEEVIVPVLPVNSAAVEALTTGVAEFLGLPNGLRVGQEAVTLMADHLHREDPADGWGATSVHDTDLARAAKAVTGKLEAGVLHYTNLNERRWTARWLTLLSNPKDYQQIGPAVETHLTRVAAVNGKTTGRVSYHIAYEPLAEKAQRVSRGSKVGVESGVPIKTSAASAALWAETFRTVPSPSSPDQNYKTLLARIKTFQGKMGPGQEMDLRQNYFPLWYALNRDRDSLGALAGEDRRQCDQDLQNLRRLYVEEIGTVPPAVYSEKNWRAIRSIPPEKVAVAFLSERPELEKAVASINDAFQKAPVKAPAAVVKADGPKLTRQEIRDQMAARVASWGNRGETFLHRVADRLISLMGGVDRTNPAPQRSRWTSANMGFWFATEIAESLWNIAQGKLAGDKRLEDFNRVFGLVGERIMRAARWTPHIDEASLDIIADVLFQAQEENRPFDINIVHNSWTDIPTIISLFDGLPIRFIYKKELEWIPGLGQILTSTGMTPVVRVKETGNPDVDGMARAKAIGQIAKIGERNAELGGTVSVHFAAGTRGRVGFGVGEPKKGAPNMEIDNDNLTLVLGVEGPGQVLQTSWLDIFLGRGAGANYAVHVRARKLDQRDHRPPAEVTGERARHKAHVESIRLQTLKDQVDADLDILDTLLAEGSLQSRVQLNEALDAFAEPFDAIDRGDHPAFLKWCGDDKHGARVSPTSVKAIHQWIPREERTAMKRRSERHTHQRVHQAGPRSVTPFTTTLGSGEIPGITANMEVAELGI